LVGIRKDKGTRLMVLITMTLMTLNDENKRESRNEKPSSIVKNMIRWKIISSEVAREL
jgi:hypothetical protein